MKLVKRSFKNLEWVYGAKCIIVEPRPGRFGIDSPADKLAKAKTILTIKSISHDFVYVHENFYSWEKEMVQLI